MAWVRVALTNRARLSSRERTVMVRPVSQLPELRVKAAGLTVMAAWSLSTSMRTLPVGWVASATV